MLGAAIIPHREYLLANQPHQKLFLQLNLSPEKQASQTRPQLSVVFVVDTSGSMREVVTHPTEYTGQERVVEGQKYEVVRGARSKLDLVADSLQGILDSQALKPQDRLALVHFDDNAHILVPFTEASQRARLLAAVESLNNHSGGTHMGAGMQKAFEILQAEKGSKRMILLTDGETFDENRVAEISGYLTRERIPVTAIGVGEFNEELLLKTADSTQGKLIDVVPDTTNPLPPAIQASQLPQEILSDMQSAASEVVTDLGFIVRTVKGVNVDRITRVAPQQNEVDMSVQPYNLGNAASNATTTFIIELTLPTHNQARLRLAQLGITYQVPGANYRGEIPPLDAIVEFTNDELMAGQVNHEVMQWVQQRNIELLIKKATNESQTNPEQAAKTMQQARNMTVKLGNTVMTQAINRALSELNSNKTISIGTAKTLKIGSKTQTLKSDSASGIPSEEEIRRMTGA